MKNENHIQEFNKIKKEVKEALENFKESPKYSAETRINIVVKGLEEALKHNAIIKASAVLFIDYTIIRISTRMMYKKIMSYLLSK